MKEQGYAKARTMVEDKAAILSLLVLVVVVAVFRGEIREKAHYLFLLYFVILLVNRIDARYSIGAALILLLFTAVLLVQKKEAFANQVAIYAYYFLVVGVVLQLIEYIRHGGEEVAEVEGVSAATSIETGSEVKSVSMQSAGNMEAVVKTEAPPQPGAARPNDVGTRIIAIGSGKGGVGKTTIVSNLAVALSAIGKKVIAMDMDIAMPNLEIAMGVKSPPVGLVDVIKRRLKIDEVAFAGPHGVKVIPPGIILEGFTDKNVRRIRSILKRVPRADFLILDMPPGREAAKVLGKVHEVLLVVNPDAASVSDALNMKVIVEKRGAKILGVILNRVAGSGNELSIDRIEEALDLKVISMIPEDEKVKEAFSSETPVVSLYPESSSSKEFIKLAAKIASYGEES